MAGAYGWPGPVHEGKGTWWSTIDKAATEARVEALFKIMGGAEQEPTTGFAIYGSTIENEPDPIFADFEFEWDLEGRKGRFLVSGVLEAEVFADNLARRLAGAPLANVIDPSRGY